MQISLFSSAIDQKELAISSLKRMDFLKARDYFTAAFEIDPSLAELGSYLKACEFLINNFNIADLNDKNTLAKGIAKIREFFTAHEINRFTFNLVEQLLCSKIIELIPVDFNDFIDERDYPVHIAYCHLVLSNYKTVREKLLPFLETPARFNSKLWGYLGDATWQLNWSGEAEKAYMHAFFIDPCQVDFLKLIHPKILKIYEQLQKIGLSKEIARFRIPIECWLNGIFRIPQGENLIVYHAQHTLNSEIPSPGDESAIKYHHFGLWLYLDQAGVLPSMDYRAREEMQKIDPALFERYLNRIDPPRVKTTDFYKKTTFLET